MPGPLLHVGATFLRPRRSRHVRERQRARPRRDAAGGDPRRPDARRRLRLQHRLAAPSVFVRWLTPAVRVLVNGQPRSYRRVPGSVSPPTSAAGCAGPGLSSAAGDCDMTQVDFPYDVDPRGRARATDEAEHIRDLVEQVLFTAPGERVNRPAFGSGLLGLVSRPRVTNWRARPVPRPGSSSGSAT